MIELRKHVRYKTLAKARINGVSEGETLLKDISITGCRVECTSYAEIKSHLRYKLEIIPEDAADVGIFELFVEASWIRTEGYSSEIGFVIVEFPKKKLFQRYVDYLAWRYSQGNSMTGGGTRGTSQGV
ncbi:MAG: PilZ domain-containing protein [Treponema sp.]|nr:PilZ domain-containing protein [Treponema sp.]